jgi:colanic acid biosynthesis glycosyl transferase WcaI
MKMKILILSQWYPPEPVKLISDLAHGLAPLGHQVQVLTGFPNYPAGQAYPGYRVRLWQRETLEGIPVVRTFLYPEHSRSAVKRVLNYLSFACSSALLGPWLVDRPDVIFVYSTPYPVGISGWLLSRLWRVPFVFNVQDLWPETLEATGMLKNRSALRLVDAMARWIYHRSAAVIVISQGFRANLVAKNVHEAKIHVISNWVDVDHYHPLEADLSLAARLGLAGRFNVMFAGTMGKAQGLDTVIQAAALLRDENLIQFVFVGDGLEARRLRAMADQMALDNVRFLGPYPEDAMPGLLALSDVLLVHLADSPLFRITVPHKIFAYAASGKPILCAVRGDAAEVVTAMGAGLACPPGDPTALAESVRRIAALPAGQRRQMGERGRQAAVQQYSCTVLVERIAQTLQAVAGRGPQRRIGQARGYEDEQV